MKNILTILFLTFTTGLLAQDNNIIDSLSFCGYKYKVPDNCRAESKYQLFCNDYSMAWIYFKKEMDPIILL